MLQIGWRWNQGNSDNETLTGPATARSHPSTYFWDFPLMSSYVFKNESSEPPLPAWLSGESSMPATDSQVVQENKSSSYYARIVFISLKWFQNNNKNKIFRTKLKKCELYIVFSMVISIIIQSMYYSRVQ